MQIHGPTHVHGSQPINSPHRVRPTQTNEAPAQSTSGVDQLDISPEADLVSRVRELPDIRADRVSQIRAEIESGVYETDEKLDIALDRLLDEFA
jgi:negative regulator of flagellin synthesis FlgM